MSGTLEFEGSRHLSPLEVRQQIASKAESEMSQQQREYVLRRQLEAIRVSRRFASLPRSREVSP